MTFRRSPSPYRCFMSCQLEPCLLPTQQPLVTPLTTTVLNLRSLNGRDFQWLYPFFTPFPRQLTTCFLANYTQALEKCTNSETVCRPTNPSQTMVQNLFTVIVVAQSHFTAHLHPKKLYLCSIIPKTGKIESTL